MIGSISRSASSPGSLFADNGGSTNRQQNVVDRRHSISIPLNSAHITKSKLAALRCKSKDSNTKASKNQFQMSQGQNYLIKCLEASRDVMELTDSNRTDALQKWHKTFEKACKCYMSETQDALLRVQG